MDTRTETKTYHVTGLMSGTSLDGLDLACCTFSYDGGIWNWRILRAETLPYPAAWKERLENMQYLSGRELIQGHVDYGHYLGQAVRDFLESHRLPCDLVSSHGH
ncbi:MAG TPA: anhydro-N-acetylmuramic acid kinase, partial [Bacteroidales bacterium]|nr:anhydro-N-acetylmuramic acid kinase [Bacteroidales bacterium]